MARQGAQRRRGVLVALSSLCAHALLLLLIPGFSAHIQAAPVLYIKLAQAAGPRGAGPKALAPDYAPEPRGARVGQLNPDYTVGTAQAAPKKPGKPVAPSSSQVKSQSKLEAKPAARQPGTPAKTAVQPPLNSPSVPAKPQTRPSAPRVEPGAQAAPAQPKAQPQPKQPGGGGGGTKPAGGSGDAAKPKDGANPGSSGGTGGSGTPGGGSGGPPGDGPPGPGGKPGPPGAPDKGPATPQGTPGGTDKPAPPPPPPPPPGPTQAELNLLEDYGAKAFKRIKSQARNSEAGVRGTVVFEFEVNRKGTLLDVRVVKSSGHNNLDNDVLEATRAAFNEPHEIIPFGKDVSLKQWSFRKSLEYPLW